MNDAAEKIRLHIADMMPVLRVAAKIAEKRGATLWLVGGLVRDALLGRPSLDADLAVDGDAAALGEELAASVGGTLVLLCETPPTARVVKDGVSFDFSPLRADDIEADLFERDLCINSMAVPLTPEGTGDLLDPTGGLSDIQFKVLRAVSEKNFFDDPLRSLRVYRFAAELEFEVASQTRSWAAMAAPGLSGVAGERVLFELTRILESPRTAKTFGAAKADGVLFSLIPELGVMARRPLGKREMERTLDLLAVFDGETELAPRLPDDVGLALSEDPLASDAVLLKTAALFRGTGKDSWEETGDGDEPSASSEVFVGACERWKASNRLKRDGARLLDLLKPTEARLADFFGGAERPRVLARFTREADRHRLAAPYFLLAERAALGQRLDQTAIHGFLVDLVRTQRDLIGPMDAKPLLDGRDLMEILKIPAGPTVGLLLEEIREERIAGAISSRDDAIALCKKILEGRGL